MKTQDVVASFALLTRLTTVADARGVDQSTLVRDALAAYLQPRRAPTSDPPHTAPQTMTTSLLQGLDPATQARIKDAAVRFQGSAHDLVRVILRQWAASMRDPRLWRAWRP
jgi:hypothetical protein